MNYCIDSRDKEIALFGVTSYDFIPGGTGSCNVNRPYVGDLMEGLSNHGFNLNVEMDAFYKEYMADEAIRCKKIDGDSPWFVDRERAIEVIPMELIRRVSEAFHAIGKTLFVILRDVTMP